MTVSEWEEIQEEVKQRIFNRFTTNKAIWIPGNVPSLKNNKDILQIYRTVSTCCSAKIYRAKRSGELQAFCSKCKKQQELKRPIIASSKRVREYKEEKTRLYQDNKYIWNVLTAGMQPPFIVGLYYIRDSKRKFDYGNASEIIQDCMTDAKYWEDDNADIMKPEHLGYSVDTQAPGVFIIPLKKAFMREVIKMI